MSLLERKLELEKLEARKADLCKQLYGDGKPPYGRIALPSKEEIIRDLLGDKTIFVKYNEYFEVNFELQQIRERYWFLKERYFYDQSNQ